MAANVLPTVNPEYGQKMKIDGARRWAVMSGFAERQP